jgi:hypothetical protein
MLTLLGDIKAIHALSRGNLSPAVIEPPQPLSYEAKRHWYETKPVPISIPSLFLELAVLPHRPGYCRPYGTVLLFSSSSTYGVQVQELEAGTFSSSVQTQAGKQSCFIYADVEGTWQTFHVNPSISTVVFHVRLWTP